MPISTLFGVKIIVHDGSRGRIEEGSCSIKSILLDGSSGLCEDAGELTCREEVRTFLSGVAGVLYGCE